MGIDEDMDIDEDIGEEATPVRPSARYSNQPWPKSGTAGINFPLVAKKKSHQFPASELHSPYTNRGKCKWPFTLLSLFHPFRISDKIDIDFETQFSLDIPFLDMKIGVQGVGESFSFVIARNKP